MDRPLVSVLLTVYNGEKYLRTAIKSVLEQSYENLELLIYNDGSTDGTETIVKEFDDVRITYWRSETNRHIAYGTNFLLKKASGELFAIMDADDIWVRDKLEKQITFLSEHREFNACFSWCDLIDEDGIIRNEELLDYYRLFLAQTNTREYWLRFFFFNGNRLCNSSAVFTAESYRNIGLHNLFYVQATDMEWWVRFTKKYAFAVMEEPLVRVRGDFNSTGRTSTNDDASRTRFVNEFECIRLHFFDEIDDDIFISTFKEYFENKNASTKDELDCEKILLRLKPHAHTKSTPASGLFGLERAMADERTADLLAEKYGFTTRSAGEYSGKHIFNYRLDDILLDHYREQAEIALSDKADAERKLKISEALVESMQERLRLYENGTASAQ